MNREDLLWLAGLLEGEGTFDLHRGRYPRIRLGITDRDVVGRAATVMGTKVRTTLRPAPWTATFHTEVQGTRAVAILWELFPLMGARRSSRIATILGHASVDRGSAPGPRAHRPPAISIPEEVAG